MKLSVFGLGYVGCVSAACFAKEGHEVVGVDVNPVKVEIINRGRSPIVEPGVNELIGEMVAAGPLRATTDSSASTRNFCARALRSKISTRRPLRSSARRMRRWLRACAVSTLAG